MLLFLRILGVFLGMALPLSAFAQLPDVSVPQGSFDFLCSATGLCTVSSIVGSNGGPAGFAGVLAFLQGVIVPAIQTIFIGVGVLYTGWYALEMIVNGHEESTLQAQKNAFGQAAIGMGIVGVSSLIVQTFAPSSVGNAIVNPAPFEIAINAIIDFITIVTGAFLIFVVGMAGARIISLQGNESERDKQKKNFFHGLMGIPILLLARIIVTSIVPGVGEPDDLIPEIAGIAKFLLELVAGLAVLALIASGILFIVALHNDALKQRAKRILFSTLVILIIVVFSQVLVATFIP